MTEPVRYRYEIGGTLDAIILDSTSTEALLIRKNVDGGDVFWVDTTNERTHFGDSNFYSTFDGTDSFIHFATNNDYLRYNRTDNTFHFTIASIDRFTVDNSTITSEVQHYVDTTSTEAFLIRKDSDGGDVFTVDTTNSQVSIPTGSALGINTSNVSSNSLRIGYNSGSQQILFERNGGVSTSNILVDSGNALCIRNQDGTSPFIDLVLSDTAINDGRVRIFNGRLQTGVNNHNIVPGHGVIIDSLGNTFTDNDTAASGTATVTTFNSFEAPTLAATNASVTTTNAATLYIEGAPIAGTNQTITNSYALWVDAGTSRFDGNILPGTTESLDLGSASLEWNNIYSQNAVTVSDFNKKKHIKEEELGLDFITNLTPKEYRYISNNNKGHGLIAQDVESVLVSLDKSPEGIVSYNINEQGEKVDYGLNYTQLIGPLINAIKEQQEQIKLLLLNNDINLELIKELRLELRELK